MKCCNKMVKLLQYFFVQEKNMQERIKKSKLMESLSLMRACSDMDPTGYIKSPERISSTNVLARVRFSKEISFNNALPVICLVSCRGQERQFQPDVPELTGQLYRWFLPRSHQLISGARRSGLLCQAFQNAAYSLQEPSHINLFQCFQPFRSG